MATIHHSYKATTRFNLVHSLTREDPQESVIRLAFKARNSIRATLVQRMPLARPTAAQVIRAIYHAAVAYIPPPKVSGNNVPTDFNATFSGG
jgi:hypothetical protein